MNQLNFNDQVLQSELPVLVDYWAEWCAPCGIMMLILDELAEGFHDWLRVTKVENKVQIAFN